MLSAGVVADANVLLSAVFGKAACRVFSDFGIPVHTTQFNAQEVLKYLPRLAPKYGLPWEIVQLQWKLLPLEIHAPVSYQQHWESARRRLDARDPDDAHPLALAHALSLPLWSNDSDLANVGVECYTTARLLKVLDEAKP